MLQKLCQSDFNFLSNKKKSQFLHGPDLRQLLLEVISDTTGLSGLVCRAEMLCKQVRFQKAVSPSVSLNFRSKFALGFLES
jgi:hypothetical protein